MYGKLFQQMYEGTLATKGPWQALVTFQQMIVLCDKNGIIDKTPEAISRITTIPIEVIAAGIIELEKSDPGSRSPEEGGRRIVRLRGHTDWGWRIVNYTKYRDLQREESRTAYHRQYWHRRKANSTDSTVTQLTQPHKPIAEAYAEADTSGVLPPSSPKEPSAPVEGSGGKRAAPFVLPDGINPEAFQEWIEWRRKNRYPVDAITLGKHCKVLAPNSMSAQAAMIDKSIGAGWRGIFALKPGDQATVKPRVRARSVDELLAAGHKE